MKNLILVVVVLLVVGCLNLSPVRVDKLVEHYKEQKALRDSVVGEYEHKEGEDIYRLVLLKNSIFKAYINGKKEGMWMITKERRPYDIGGQLQLTEYNGKRLVFRINEGGSITIITLKYADWTREDIPKEKQWTAKKIK